MEIRRPLEWHCKQMDHFVGLNFKSNFNFALVGHLLKGETSKIFATVKKTCLRNEPFHPNMLRLQASFSHHCGTDSAHPAHASQPGGKTSQL